MEGWRKFRESLRGWTWHHLVVFLLTFFSYAAFHACRKSFSNIKHTMVKSLSPLNQAIYPYDVWQKEHMFTNETDGNVFFGELDFLFLLAYAFGLFFSGMIGDRVNLRYMVTVGMFSSALLTFLFGYVSVLLNVRNQYYFEIIYFFNGLFQSTGWPAFIPIMGNWFSKSSGGLVFGVWGANMPLGNIFGSLIVASVLQYGYEYGVALNSLLLFCSGVIVFVCLIPHPNLIGLESPDNETGNGGIGGEEIELQSNPKVSGICGGCDSGESKSTIEDNSDKFFMKNGKSNGKKAIGFFQALLIPGVIMYSLANAFLKLVLYSFAFWLPLYLSQGLHWADDKSDQLSCFFDIGNIIGGIVTGVITDFMGVRSPAVSFMLLLSIGSVYLYAHVGDHYLANVAVMVLNGILIGGPSAIIGTAITADLGKHEKLQGNSVALSTVTGITDGTGSLGAAIGQYLVGVIYKHGGWHWVFNFLIIMTGLSFICILPILVKDLRTLCARRGSEQYEKLVNRDS